MMVRLLTGPKAGKIADVTNEHGRNLITSGQAENADHLPSPEILPSKPEAEEKVVFVPIPTQEPPASKPSKRRFIKQQKS